MATSTMKLKLHVWRQESPEARGGFVTYEADANEHMSFLEMLDVLNEQLVARGEPVVVFDHDCREGICGACGAVVNGRAHGPEGNVYALERIKGGKHAAIMKYNLNQE